MTSRANWKLFVCALLISGCQAPNLYLPWQTSSKQEYSSNDLASTIEPMPAAAANQITTPSAQPGNVVARTVSSTRSEPVAAGRIDQLIRSGQAAIRDSGRGDTSKLTEARQYFQQVLAADPQNSSGHHGLAIVADLQKDWVTADAHYRQALQQRPEDPSLLNDLGYSYLLQNRFYESEQYLQRAIQLSPQHERAHINLALLSLKRDNEAAARTQLAAIYSQPEVEQTLTRLRGELGQSSTAGTPLGLPNQPNRVTATANLPIGQPQPMHSAGMASPNPPAPMTTANYNASAVPLINNAGPAFNTGADPRPVSVYPDSMPQNNATQPQSTTPSIPGTAGNPPWPGGTVAAPAGVPVGGVIGSPVSANPQPANYGAAAAAPQYPAFNPQYNSAGSVNGVSYKTPATQAPATQQPGTSAFAGLNAGPGTLFPVAPTSGGAPASAIPQQNYRAPLNAPANAAPVNVPQQQFFQHPQPPGQAGAHVAPSAANPVSSVSMPQPVSANYGPAANYGTTMVPGNMPTNYSVPNPPVNTLATPAAGVNAAAGSPPMRSMLSYEQQLQQQRAGQFNQSLQQYNGHRPLLNNGVVQ